LKTALEKIKNVRSVDLPDGTQNAVVTFTGKCDQLGALETAALNAGVPALVVNHAHVMVSFKPLKGADLKSAREEVTLLPAVVGVTATAGGLELHADLEKLTMEDIKAAAGKFNCDVAVNQTFEFAKYKVVEGDFEVFQRTVPNIKGVMTVREEGDNTLGMWIHRTFVKVDQIEKIKDIKVARQ